MPQLRLRSITAISDADYALVFDSANGSVETICHISVSVVPLANFEPNLASTSEIGDPRKIVAAVMATHRARQVDVYTF